MSGSTSIRRTCDHCEDDGVDLKACSGCKTSWYCNASCQRAAWWLHKLWCKPLSDLTTAERLYRFILDDELPDDEQTCLDWGFFRTHTPQNQAKLLGLYAGLTRLNVRPATLRKWRADGILCRKIKKSFEALPVTHRGGYYA